MFSECVNQLNDLTIEERDLVEKVSQAIWRKAKIPELYILKSIYTDWHGDPDAKDYVLNYIGNIDYYFDQGVGLHLYGEYGRGKTFLACELLKILIRSYNPRDFPYYQGRFITFADLVNLYTEGWRDLDAREEMDKILKTIDFLVIDDLGREFKSKGNLNSAALDSVIRGRIYAKKPIIVTTNRSMEEIAYEYDPGIVSLLSEGCMNIQVTGSDFRIRGKE